MNNLIERVSKKDFNKAQYVRAAVSSCSATTGNPTFPTRFYNLRFVYLIIIFFECSQDEMYEIQSSACALLHACEPNVQSELTLSRKSQNKTRATLFSLMVFTGARLGAGSPGTPVSQHTVPRTGHLT